ncbi:MAG: hypothetical protein ACRDZO_08570 [Egibacteraceae bacterium]
MKPLSQREVNRLLNDWHRRLDLHAPVEAVLELLAEEDFEMRTPQGILTTAGEFKRWYDEMTRRFFDETRAITRLTITRADDTAEVKMVVNWQARTWNPPAARSKWLDFDAYETLIVRRSRSREQPVISTYIVEALRPLSDSTNVWPTSASPSKGPVL